MDGAEAPFLRRPWSLGSAQYASGEAAGRQARPNSSHPRWKPGGPRRQSPKPSPAATVQPGLPWPGAKACASRSGQRRQGAAGKESEGSVALTGGQVRPAMPSSSQAFLGQKSWQRIPNPTHAFGGRHPLGLKPWAWPKNKRRLGSRPPPSLHSLQTWPTQPGWSWSNRSPPSPPFTIPTAGQLALWGQSKELRAFLKQPAEIELRTVLGGPVPSPDKACNATMCRKVSHWIAMRLGTWERGHA